MCAKVNQKMSDSRLTATQLLVTFGVLIVTVSAVLMMMTNSGPTSAMAMPMDLYDDVSDLFEAMTLDEVPGAKQETKKAPADLCKMPARKGVCRALIPRWSYDAQRKDCVEFKFGGCDGNDNNFPSYNACMDTCKGIEM